MIPRKLEERGVGKVIRFLTKYWPYFFEKGARFLNSGGAEVDPLTPSVPSQVKFVYKDQVGMNVDFGTRRRGLGWSKIPMYRRRTRFPPPVTFSPS